MNTNTTKTVYAYACGYHDGRLSAVKTEKFKNNPLLEVHYQQGYYQGARDKFHISLWPAGAKLEDIQHIAA